MSANVEWMFSGNSISVWHGIGEIIKGTVTSEEAIKLAKLDWDVVPKPIYDGLGRELPGYKVNVRSTDNQILGVVTDKYKIIQNKDAFAFTDELLGEGVQYETAGSLASGKRVWMLARMENTLLAEENVDPFLVFTNSHDGKGAVRVAMVPIRVICQNTLNLALQQASRHWSCSHMGDIDGKLEDARNTLTNAHLYMEALEEEFGELKLKKVTDDQVRKMTDLLLKMEFEDLYKRATMDIDKTLVSFDDIKRKRKAEVSLNYKRAEIINIYNDKPDLRDTERTAFRFVNAVSDWATHTTDHKNTRNYQENLFMKVADGYSIIDTAHKIAKAA